MSPEIQKRIKRLHERGVPVPNIARAMGRAEDQIETFLKKCRAMANARNAAAIKALVTVKSPESWLRQRGVRYD